MSAPDQVDGVIVDQWEYAEEAPDKQDKGEGKNILGTYYAVYNS